MVVKVRRVPWRNKEEWLEVYNKLQNFNNLAKIEEVVQHMEIWIKRGHCPPAVEYTCKFMQSIGHDPYFFPSTCNPESDTNLQVQYVTSILRFINILGEVDSEKSLSLNARALKIGLPEWVVNTRHQISHGSCLPSLDLLRISVDSLLKWLKTNYWDLERDAIQDLILPNKVILLEDKLTQLLDIYISLHEESNMNSKYVRNIRNHEIKQKVFNLGKLFYQVFRNELRPYDAIATPADGSLCESKQLLNMTIPNAISLVVRTIKPYFEHEMSSSTRIFVNYLSRDSAKEEICVARWRPLLLALHARGKFPYLLDKLVDCGCNEDFENNIKASEWTIFLLKSLLKRYKVQKKLNLMTSNSVPSSKRIKLHLTEREISFLAKDRVKHQLSIETGTRESDDVLVKLFEVIERKNPALQLSLQLQESKFLTEQEIYQLVQKVFLSPNKSTTMISELLLKLSNRLNRSAVGSLLDLVKLKSNILTDSSKRNLHVFDSTSLARHLRPDSSSHCQ